VVKLFYVAWNFTINSTKKIKEVKKVLANKEGDPWIRRALMLLPLLILTVAASPAEARFFQDPSPRVVEAVLPVEKNAQAQNTVYLIKSGDTLITIARKFQVSLEQLAAMNKLRNPNKISVGQTLAIPAVGAGDKQPVNYQIKQGDTLWDIAKMYSSEMEAIIAANQLKNPDLLMVGDQLVIPAGDNIPAMGTNLGMGNLTPANFSWPVQGVITSTYGRRWGEFHYGLDIAAESGTPVKASAAGTVVAAGWRGTYGQTVIIEHDETYRTLYAHNSAIQVKEGDQVGQGQVIARLGSTGKSTGPHLHFEVHQNEKAMDPLKFLRTNGN
jgi:murein DD-endopeptidase MepM/ murein hydrolase activator NlpD